MDVIVETKGGDRWKLEIGFFDTVREIKEKIQKYHGILVSLQTLFFNGIPLADGLNTEYYVILQGSRIQLHVGPEPGKPYAEDASVQVARMPANVATSKRQFAIEANLTDSIGRFKEGVQEAEGRPALFLGNTAMQDNHTVAHYGLGGEKVDVKVVARPRPLPVGAATAAAKKVMAATAAAKKVRVMVELPRGGMRKIAVEVNTADRVSELRKELQRLQGPLHFHLPERYFFIHAQDVMEERRTLRWHEVKPGDTIDVFPGWVGD